MTNKEIYTMLRNNLHSMEKTVKTLKDIVREGEDFLSGNITEDIFAIEDKICSMVKHVEVQDET